MEEEYLLNKMIKGKTEKEREIELMQNIIETKEKLQNARKNFEYAEDGMIDYYIYQIKPNHTYNAQVSVTAIEILFRFQ